MTAERNYNWDYLRFLASVAVVVLHVSYSYMSVASVERLPFVAMTAYNATTRFAVPVFFMLSGLFLLSPDKKISIKDCWKRTAKLFAVFYIWSAFYGFQGLIMDYISGETITGGMVAESFRRLLMGHGHMWFLFCLAAYYLMLPVARCISANKSVLTYFCVFWIMLRFVIPFISIWLPLGYFNMWLAQFDFQFFMTYFGYFCLGYWLQITDIPKKLRAVLYALGGISAVWIFAATVYESQKVNELVEDWLNPSALPPFVCAVSIFIFFKYHGEIAKGKWNRVIRQLSRYSLLIYMLHPFFVEKLNMIGINTIRFHAAWSVPVLSILIVAVCVGVAWVVDRIPVLNKVLLK